MQALQSITEILNFKEQLEQKEVVRMEDKNLEWLDGKARCRWANPKNEL